jgi:hypothetical protein
MTAPDEIRDAMNELWVRADADADAAKNSFIPIDRARRMIASLQGEERTAAERTLAEWALSEDGGQRYDAQVLIRELKVRDAIPALIDLAHRLAQQPGPQARDERELVEQLIDELQADAPA